MLINTYINKDLLTIYIRIQVGNVPQKRVDLTVSERDNKYSILTCLIVVYHKINYIHTRHVCNEYIGAKVLKKHSVCTVDNVESVKEYFRFNV